MISPGTTAVVTFVILAATISFMALNITTPSCASHRHFSFTDAPKTQTARE